ncbi:MAG TPA: M48 family metallopeptidase [Candidatus Binatia bacterium]
MKAARTSRGGFGLFVISLGILSTVFSGFRYSPVLRDRGGSAIPYSDSSRRGDASGEDRLRRTIVPLIRAMDRPCQSDELRVQIMNEPTINAANAGGCQFFVTSGLLQRANDDHLLGVMAHEIAHQDLGHAVKAQMLGAGLSIGAALLEQILPGSGAIAPLAGTLIARGHSRTEEYAADRHAIVLLRRIGYPPDVMIDTLSWIQRSSGQQHAGGFLSTHPALNDRISALKKIR